MTKRPNVTVVEHKPGRPAPTALIRPTSRHEAERVITMYVAPGTSSSIRPEDVIRAEGETDEDYAARQALAVELWSIPDNAGDAHNPGA